MAPSVLLAHGAAVFRLCDVKSAWWKTATVTLSYLRGTRGSYRSCNPLWADTTHPSLPFALKGKSRCASTAGAQLRETAQHPHARNLGSAGLLKRRSKYRRTSKTAPNPPPQNLVAAVHACIMWSEDREIWPDWVFLFNFRTAVWIHHDYKKTWILHVEFGSSFEIPKKSILEVML